MPVNHEGLQGEPDAVLLGNVDMEFLRTYAAAILEA